MNGVVLSVGGEGRYKVVPNKKGTRLTSAFYIELKGYFRHLI